MLFHTHTNKILLHLLLLAYSVNKLYAFGDEHKHRVKRKVIFTKNSKLFFRLNGKDNVVPWNQIFAHGWAIRINYDLPESVQKRHKFFKRDIHKELQTFTNNGQSSQSISCILRHFCEIASSLQSTVNCGFFCEIGRIIARKEGVEANFFKSFLDKCEIYSGLCPHLNLFENFAPKFSL